MFEQLQIDGRNPEAHSMPFSRWSLRFNYDHHRRPIITLHSAWSEVAQYKMVGEFPLTRSILVMTA
jgi:hypothetical protein